MLLNFLKFPYMVEINSALRLSGILPLRNTEELMNGQTDEQWNWWTAVLSTFQSQRDFLMFLQIKANIPNLVQYTNKYF